MDDKNKYNNALEKLQEALAPKDGCEISGLTRACIEEIFPELKESEDNRIKKEIISALKYANHKGVYDKHIVWLEKQDSIDENKVIKRVKIDISTSLINYINANSKGMYLSDIECEDIEDAIVNNKWYKVYNYMKKELEKQEEKPQGKTALEAANEEKADNANKVEPKFHEGEWIVWENQYYKVNYNGCGYELVGQNGLDTSLEYGTVDENAHHWDIAKDAKEGDVLVSDNIVFIFNKIHDVWINCHCSLYEDDSFYGGDFDLMHIRYGKEVYPATKEQRDVLMKAMADSGWQFDFEKKELTKVEPKFKVKLAGREYNVLEIKESAGVKFYGIEDEPNHIDYVLSDDCEIISGYGEKKKDSPYPTKSVIFSEQNPVWSEEDEKNLKRAIWYIENPALNVIKDIILSEWLKSIKERINNKKLIDIINKAAEWWLIHDSYSKDTNNLVNDFKTDLLKYVDISE